MSLLAALPAAQGPWWATPAAALLGALFGATTTLLATFLIDSRKAQRDAEIAEEGRRREAYMEILSWLARSRDELRRAIEDRRPFNHAFADDREQGRLDALSELAATHEFREALSRWPDAFHEALHTYEKLRSLPDTDPDDAQAKLDVGHQLEDQLKTLRDVIDRVREQARWDTSSA
jgi:hypothetical protein